MSNLSPGFTPFLLILVSSLYAKMILYLNKENRDPKEAMAGPEAFQRFCFDKSMKLS